MERTRTERPAIVRYDIMYFSSTSFRLAARSLSPIKKKSHVSLWNWLQKYSDLAADRFRIDRMLVKGIFVDETTLLRIDGQVY